MGIARPKLGFEGRLSTSTPSTPHPHAGGRGLVSERRLVCGVQKRADPTAAPSQRTRKTTVPSMPRGRPLGPARVRGGAAERRQGPSLGPDKRWHSGGGGPRLRGSWTYPAGQVSTEREVGRDSLGLRGPAPTHAPPVGTLGAVDRPTDPRTDGPRGKAAPSPAGPRSCGARGWGPG